MKESQIKVSVFQNLDSGKFFCETMMDGTIVYIGKEKGKEEAEMEAKEISIEVEKLPEAEGVLQYFLGKNPGLENLLEEITAIGKNPEGVPEKDFPCISKAFENLPEQGKMGINYKTDDSLYLYKGKFYGFIQFFCLLTDTLSAKGEENASE